MSIHLFRQSSSLRWVNALQNPSQIGHLRKQGGCTLLRSSTWQKQGGCTLLKSVTLRKQGGCTLLKSATLRKQGGCTLLKSSTWQKQGGIYIDHHTSIKMPGTALSSPGIYLRFSMVRLHLNGCGKIGFDAFFDVVCGKPADQSPAFSCSL